MDPSCGCTGAVAHGWDGGTHAVAVGSLAPTGNGDSADHDPATRELPAMLPTEAAEGLEELPPPPPTGTPAFPAAAAGFPGTPMAGPTGTAAAIDAVLPANANAADLTAQRDAELVTVGWQEPATPEGSPIATPATAATQVR